MKLSRKLSIYLIGLIFLIQSITTLVDGLLFRQDEISRLQEFMLIELNHIEVVINNFFGLIYDDMRTVSQHIINEGDELSFHLESYSRDRVYIDKVYFLRSDGLLITPEQTYQFDTNYQFYQNAVTKTGNIITSTFYNTPLQESIILGISYAIENSGEILGVLTIDMNFNEIQSFFNNNLNISSHELKIFIDKELEYISDIGIPLKGSDRENEDITGLFNSPGGIYNFKGAYYVTKKIDILPITLYFSFTSSDIDFRFSNLFYRLIFMNFILLVLLIYIFNLILKRIITNPITKITYEAINYSENGFINEKNLQLTSDEIGILSRKFYHIAEENLEHRINLGNLVEERTAELEKLTKAMDQSPSSIIISNEQDIIEYVNQRFTELTGFTAEESIGNPYYFYFNKDLNSLEKNKILSTCLSGQIWYGEFYNTRKTGEQYWEHVTKSCMTNLSESSIHFIGVHTDISEQKRITRELAEAKKKAEEAVETKSIFLANTSHEIRTPMNAIINLIKLLKDTPLNTKQMDYTYKAEQSAESLLTIINDILDISKIEANKIELEERDFLLESVLDNVETMVTHKVKEKNLEFSIIREEGLPEVIVGDSIRLGQIILNLVSNAVKFTDRGKVVVHLSHKLLGADRIDLHIEVRDTGIGLTEDQVNNLFKAFNQADNSTTRKFGGTGLGLTISKYLTQLMGGSIGVSSNPGVGSVFFFNVHVGLSKFKREDMKIEEKTETHDFSGLRILLADDNEINRMVTMEMIRKYNIEVDSVINGQEVLDKIEGNKGVTYDLILMDLQMPVMDGYSATKQLRQQYSTEELPIVAYTADMISTVTEKLVEYEFNDILSKPLLEKDLIRLLVKYYRVDEQDDITAGLMKKFGHNESLVNNILQVFIYSYESFGVKLLKSIEYAEYEKVKNMLHKLQGESGKMVLEDLLHKTTTLYNMISSGIEDRDYFYQESVKLVKTINRTVEKAKKICS